MTYAPHSFDEAAATLPRMPSWLTRPRPETLEDVALLSGAMLTHLDLVVHHGALPSPLFRDRLSVLSAEACSKLAGRPERAADLRDEVHLARPGDTLGPGGAVLAAWRKHARAPLKGSVRGGQSPLAAAAVALQTALETDPGNESAALMAADTALAQSLGWSHMLPVLALGVQRRELRHRDRDLRLACARAVVSAGQIVAPLAQDLARRAGRMLTVAPKLRAKGAGAAVSLFLSTDALSPTVALSPIVNGSTTRMSDRAARRLCDRLVGLGLVRELTGRDTFRLYGL